MAWRNIKRMNHSTKTDGAVNMIKSHNEAGRRRERPETALTSFFTLSIENWRLSEGFSFVLRSTCLTATSLSTELDSELGREVGCWSINPARKNVSLILSKGASALGRSGTKSQTFKGVSPSFSTVKHKCFRMLVSNRREGFLIINCF